MSWRDRLQPASFRGAAFRVSGHEHGTGRRLVEHRYPGKDGTWHEDLGLKAREFTVEAFVLGDDYMTRRDALLAACETRGPGLLVHPYLGRKRVKCRDVRQRESTAEGRMSRLTLEFVEAGRNEYPAGDPDRSAALGAAAAAARLAASAQLESDWIPPGTASWVYDAASDDLGALAARIGDVAGAPLAAGAPKLARDAAAMGAAIAAALSDSPSLDALAGVAASPLGARPAIPLTTANRRVEAAARAALGRAASSFAAIEFAGRAASSTWPDRPSAEAARTRLIDVGDDALADAPADVYRTLGALVPAAAERIALGAVDLPEIVEAAPGAVLPAQVLSWRWYGDALHADEIAARADAVRPGFVPADPIGIPAP